MKWSKSCGDYASLWGSKCTSKSKENVLFSTSGRKADSLACGASAHDVFRRNDIKFDTPTFTCPLSKISYAYETFINDFENFTKKSISIWIFGSSYVPKVSKNLYFEVHIFIDYESNNKKLHLCTNIFWLACGTVCYGELRTCNVMIL